MPVIPHRSRDAYVALLDNAGGGFVICGICRVPDNRAGGLPEEAGRDQSRRFHGPAGPRPTAAPLERNRRFGLG